MERHREILLQQALDEVMLVGSTAIDWGRLYQIFGVQRLAKKPWRDIQKLWEDLCEERGFEQAVPLTVMMLEFVVVLRREPFENEKVQDISELAA